MTSFFGFFGFFAPSQKAFGIVFLAVLGQDFLACGCVFSFSSRVTHPILGPGSAFLGRGPVGLFGLFSL